VVQLLRKKYQQAVVKSQIPSASHLLQAAQIRMDILETLRRWLDQGSGAEDALDDQQLYDAFKSFLEAPSEHESYTESQELQLREAWNSLDQMRKTVAALFTAHTLRPPSKSNSTSDLLSGTEIRAFGINPPDLDTISAEDFANNIDAMAAAAFRNVTDEVRLHLI
jgi:GTPase-activating protein BEM2